MIRHKAKFGSLGAAAVAAITYLAAPLPAQADVYTNYEISPTIELPHNVYSSDLISGTFVWDDTTDAISSVDFTVTGTYEPGTYDVVATTFGESFTEISACIPGLCSHTINILHLYFLDPLGGSSDPITDVSWDAAAQSKPTNSPVAVSLPEPASLALFGAALLGLGGMYRRRRP